MKGLGVFRVVLVLGIAVVLLLTLSLLIPRLRMQVVVRAHGHLLKSEDAIKRLNAVPVWVEGLISCDGQTIEVPWLTFKVPRNTTLPDMDVQIDDALATVLLGSGRFIISIPMPCEHYRHFQSTHVTASRLGLPPRAERVLQSYHDLICIDWLEWNRRVHMTSKLDDSVLRSLPMEDAYDYLVRAALKLHFTKEARRVVFLAHGLSAAEIMVDSHGDAILLLYANGKFVGMSAIGFSDDELLEAAVCMVGTFEIIDQDEVIQDVEPESRFDGVAPGLVRLKGEATEPLEAGRR
jgi:hypothetical protein